MKRLSDTDDSQSVLISEIQDETFKIYTVQFHFKCLFSLDFFHTSYKFRRKEKIEIKINYKKKKLNRKENISS